MCIYYYYLCFSVWLFRGRFSRNFKKWAPKMPTCQSRRIAVRSLAGAFASVPPRRVSIDDLIFSPDGATATLIMNSSTSTVGLKAHVQH